MTYELLKRSEAGPGLLADKPFVRVGRRAGAMVVFKGKHGADGYRSRKERQR
jgi:hypothetical protein